MAYFATAKFVPKRLPFGFARHSGQAQDKSSIDCTALRHG